MLKAPLALPSNLVDQKGKEMLRAVGQMDLRFGW